MMQLVNNLQAATFVLFSHNSQINDRKQSYLFLLRYISRSHNHSGFKASVDASICILCFFLSLSVSLQQSPVDVILVHHAATCTTNKVMSHDTGSG